MPFTTVEEAAQLYRKGEFVIIVDDEYRGRVLLAEANQWPSDVVQYFGDAAVGGDECHMAFHFPLMPRIFMAVRRESRPLYRSPHLYLAALLSVAIQAPVFYWNLTEGLASYKFHLSERWGGNISLTGNHLPEFVLVALIALVL